MSDGAEHNDAVADPHPGEELMIVTLFSELVIMGMRFKRDTVMLSTLEKLGAVIIELSHEQTGRLDPYLIQRGVRHVIHSAGGNVDNL